MKKLTILILVLLTCTIGLSQALESKTSVVNGLVLTGKTTAAIQALTVAPNGYQQYSTDTQSIWLKTATGWIDTKVPVIGNNAITTTQILDGTILETDLATAVANKLNASGGAELQSVTQAEFNALTQPQKDAFTGYIVDVNGSNSASQYYDVLFEQILTGDYTAVAADFDSGKKIIVNNTANNYVVTIPDVAGIGEKLLFSQYGSGKIQVGMGVGVTGTSFQTIDNTSSVTMYKSSSGYRPIGAYDAYTPVPPVVNLFPNGNSASPTPNEANSTSGWVGTDATVVSNGTDFINGTHSIEITATNNNGSDRAAINITGIDITKTYTLSYSAKAIGTNAFVQILSGDLDGSQYLQSISNGTWTVYTATINPNLTTISFRANAVNQNAIGSIGDKLFIDNVTFVEQ